MPFSRYSGELPKADNLTFDNFSVIDVISELLVILAGSIFDLSDASIQSFSPSMESSVKAAA